MVVDILKMLFESICLLGGGILLVSRVNPVLYCLISQQLHVNNQELQFDFALRLQIEWGPFF